MNKWQKITFSIVSIVLIVSVVVGGFFFYKSENKTSTSPGISADEIINRTEKDIEVIQIRIDNIELSVANLEKSESETKAEISDIQARLDALEEGDPQIATLQSELKEVQASLKGIQSNITTMQQDITTLKGYKQLIETIQEEVIALQNSQVNLTNSLTSIIARLEHVESQLTTIVSNTRVIYDCRSSDESVNWGYTNGLQSSNITGSELGNSKLIIDHQITDFAQYSSFKVTIELGAPTLMIDVNSEIHTWTGTFGTFRAGTGSGYYWGINGAQTFSAAVFVCETKIVFIPILRTSDGKLEVAKSEYCKIVKIEGVR